MTYLLDTCIISKLRKLSIKPDIVLSNWISKHDESLYFLSIITIGEIQLGISKLNTNNANEKKFKMLLEDWLFGDLIPRFKDRIFDIDLNIILTWGKMDDENQKMGNLISTTDGLIAATAKQYNLIVVTENVKHFEKTGVDIFNPFEAANDFSKKR